MLDPFYRGRRSAVKQTAVACCTASERQHDFLCCQLNTKLFLFSVFLQGAEVGLWVRYFSARGSLWHRHVCRLVRAPHHYHHHTHTLAINAMPLIFFFFLHRSSCVTPPPAAGPSPALSPPQRTHAHTHSYTCSDARLPPFYTKLLRFHAWCPSKWMT